MSEPSSLPSQTQDTLSNPIAFLQGLYEDAVKSADPLVCLPPYLKNINPKGRIIVIGAGKASASMVQAVEKTWPDKQIEGLAVTRYGYDLPTDKIELVQASHPIPDEAGEKACRRILEKLEDLTEDDFVLFLISGGGSALLSLPAPCLSSQEKRNINKALLRSGARIHEMNCVRKHLSSVKGGQLAMAAHPAQSLTLVISDVPGDNLDVIASGPTVPDHSTQADALDIIKRYKIDVSDTVIAWLNDPANETPKPDNTAFSRHDVQIIAKAQDMLDRAEAYATKQNIQTFVLSDREEGEARDVGKQQIAMAIEHKTQNPDAPPLLILSGGEATVTIKGNGKGGPNTEFVLSAMITAEGHGSIYGLSCDSDGIDGSEDNAGSYFTPECLKNAESKGLSPETYLENNDSYSFFKEMGTLIVTGPTYTNVNDFRALLVL